MRSWMFVPPSPQAFLPFQAIPGNVKPPPIIEHEVVVFEILLRQGNLVMSFQILCASAMT